MKHGSAGLIKMFIDDPCQRVGSIWHCPFEPKRGRWKELLNQHVIWTRGNVLRQKKKMKTSGKQVTDVPACFVKIRLMTQLTRVIKVWKHCSKIFIVTFSKSPPKLSGKYQSNLLQMSAWHPLAITVDWLDCFSESQSTIFRKCSSYVVMSPTESPDNIVVLWLL